MPDQDNRTEPTPDQEAPHTADTPFDPYPRCRIRIEIGGTVLDRVLAMPRHMGHAMGAEIARNLIQRLERQFHDAVHAVDAVHNMRNTIGGGWDAAVFGNAQAQNVYRPNPEYRDVVFHRREPEQRVTTQPLTPPQPMPFDPTTLLGAQIHIGDAPMVTTWETTFPPKDPEPVASTDPWDSTYVAPAPAPEAPPAP